MKKIVILENIRSAYNVGNIIRTADALGWEVWLVWYTPTPDDNKRVGKSALGAESFVPLASFVTTSIAIQKAKDLWCAVIAAEITPTAKSLDTYSCSVDGIAVVFGNEVVGVDQETLDAVDDVVYIPMQWHKESLNVWQTSAIFMWELGK